MKASAPCPACADASCMCHLGAADTVHHVKCPLHGCSSCGGTGKPPADVCPFCGQTHDCGESHNHPISCVDCPSCGGAGDRLCTICGKPFVGDQPHVNCGDTAGNTNVTYEKRDRPAVKGVHNHSPDTCETGGYCGCHRGRPMNWNPDGSCPGCNCGTGDQLHKDDLTDDEVAAVEHSLALESDRPTVTDEQVEAAVDEYLLVEDRMYDRGDPGNVRHVVEVAMRAALEAARRVQEEQENG